MMKAVVLVSILCTSVLATPVEQSLVFNQDGSYQFNYDTGAQEGRHARQEVRNADGSVEGRYSYEDPDGNLRVVNYRAGREGFVASGDVGVPGAPKSQLPLVVPTSNETPELNSTQGQDDKTTLSPTKDAITTTTLPPADLSDDKTKLTEEGGKKREAGSPQVYGQDFLNLVPLSTPFGRRRLEVPDQINKDDAHYANADVPSEEPVKESPVKETVPSKPGNVQPLNFIYAVGSPFVPTLLHAPQPEGDKQQLQQQHIPDGKGAAKYYIYVPSHHYFGSPSYYYVPQNDLKPVTPDNKDGVAQQVSPVVQPESVLSYHPSIQPVSQPALPVQPQTPLLPLPVAHYNPQPNLPLTYHTTIHHQVPTKAAVPQEASIGVPNDSGVGAPQESAGGVKIPSAWAYMPVAQHNSASVVPGDKQEKPETLLTYIQPDSAKYVPASKPVDNKVQAGQYQPESYQSAEPQQYQPESYQSVQPNQYQPAQSYSVSGPSRIDSGDQPSLRRPVYHHYVFKSPNAAYGYHYQY